MCGCDYCTGNIKGVKESIKKLKAELKRLKAKGIKQGALSSNNEDERTFAVCETELEYAYCWLENERNKNEKK